MTEYFENETLSFCQVARTRNDHNSPTATQILQDCPQTKGACKACLQPRSFAFAFQTILPSMLPPTDEIRQQQFGAIQPTPAETRVCQALKISKQQAVSTTMSSNAYRPCMHGGVPTCNLQKLRNAVGFGYTDGIADAGSEDGQGYESWQLPQLDLELGVDVLKSTCVTWQDSQSRTQVNMHSTLR